MTKLHLDHLNPTARELARATDDLRIDNLLCDRFIAYDAVAEILGHVDFLVSSPLRLRASGLAITGHPGAGKSMLASAIERAYPLIPATSTEPAIQPVVQISMTAAREARALYDRTLDALLVPIAARMRACDRERLAIKALQQARTRVLIVDEVSDVLHATVYQRRSAFDAIKRLMNECRVAIVVLGDQVERAMKTDPHLNARFKYRTLPTWGVDDALKALLAVIEESLPLRKPSHLTRPGMMKDLIALSGGSLSNLMHLLMHAAIRAIREGTERIDADGLKFAAATLPQGRVDTWTKAA